MDERFVDVTLGGLSEDLRPRPGISFLPLPWCRCKVALAEIGDCYRGATTSTDINYLHHGAKRLRGQTY